MARYLQTLALTFALLPMLHTQTASAQVEGPGPVQAVIRAETKGDNVSLKPSDLKLDIEGKPAQITSLQPLFGPNAAPMQIAVVVDDSLRGGFGLQLQEIEDFITTTVSPRVSVGIGYMQNGSVVFPAGFSTDADTALKAVRMPLGMGGISASPYFCLQDLLKKWQPRPGVARVVLMITNGIDLYNGSVRPENQDSPYVAAAATDAARAGVPVYSIYFGRREVNSNLGSFSGQGYLGQLGETTGGELFNSGQINPNSIAPYFHKFQADLHESYLLTFQSTPRKDQRLKVTSLNKSVKIHTAQTAPLLR